MSRPRRPRLLFVNKTQSSASLSHSEGSERIQVFSTAQRTSRKSSNRKGGHSIGNEKESSMCPNSVKHKTNAKLSFVTRVYALPDTTQNAAVNRNQMTARFFDIYYPVGMPARKTIIDKLRQWMEPQHGAVALAAADSLALVHAAQTTGDINLREDGMQRYHIALQLLRDELHHPESARDDSVLGAVEIFGVVETRLLKSLEGDGDKISRAHKRGLCALMLARGPLLLQSSVGKNILLQHLHEPLMVALLTRRASVFGNSDWQAAFHNTEGDVAGRMYQLTALGCCIPRAFEQADTTISNNASTKIEFMDLLAELTTLEDRFLKWLLDRYRSLPSGEPYRTTTASLSTILHNLPAELQERYPFPFVVEYNCLMDLLAHINYWGLLLMLRRTILDVLVALESAPPSSASLARSSHHVRAKCSEMADLFCESTCYVYGLHRHQSKVARQGMVAFLIATVLPWYCYDQDEEKAKWCRILIQTLQNEHKDLDLVETIQHTWTTKLYIGWVNMAF